MARATRRGCARRSAEEAAVLQGGRKTRDLPAAHARVRCADARWQAAACIMCRLLHKVCALLSPVHTHVFDRPSRRRARLLSGSIVPQQPASAGATHPSNCLSHAHPARSESERRGARNTHARAHAARVLLCMTEVEPGNPQRNGVCARCRRALPGSHLAFLLLSGSPGSCGSWSRLPLCESL